MICSQGQNLESISHQKVSNLPLSMIKTITKDVFFKFMIVLEKPLII